MPKTETRTDEDALQDFNELFRRDNDPARIIREIGWYRNILFYLGEQWISWFAKQGTFGFRFSVNTFEPTPVTNIIRDHVRSMKALILNKKYAARIWPNSEEQADKDASELGGFLLKHFEGVRCNELDDTKELVALWLVLVGVAFARTYPSKDTGCYIRGKNGKVQCVPDVAVENVIPFSIFLPELGDRINKKRCVGIQGLKEKEWVEDTFKVLIDKPDERSGADIEYEKTLMSLVANVSPWKGRSIDQEDLTMKPNEKLCLFREIEYRPTMRYPEGRYEAAVGQQVVFRKEELPIKKGEDGDWEYTITEFQYNHTPGGFWSTAGVDDLISPQIIINEVDRDLASNRKSIGRPFVLTPTDLIMKRKSQQGASFLQIEYDPTSAGGLKPEVERGTPYPQQVLEERKLHVEGAQNAAGDPKNILRGQSPHSGASGVMVDILRESAELSHTPDIERFYRSWNRVKRKQLIVAKDIYNETRIIKVAGEGNQILIKSFKGADLHNNTDVRLEIDSGVSSTRAGQNEFILNLVRNNFFGDISMRPDVQYELLRRFGMSWVPVTTSVHEDRARRENAYVSTLTNKEIKSEDDKVTGKKIYYADGLFYGVYDENVDGGVVFGRDQYFKYDDHNIHYTEHVKFILGKEFMALPVSKQEIMIGHADMHNSMLKLKAQEQADAMARTAMIDKHVKSPGRPTKSGAPSEPGEGPGNSEGIPETPGASEVGVLV